jgi:hypothetical protein
VIKLHYYQIGTSAENSIPFEAANLKAAYISAIMYFDNEDVYCFGSSERI